MSVAEAIHPPPSSPFIGTISASIPLNYNAPLDTSQLNTTSDSSCVLSPRNNGMSLDIRNVTEDSKIRAKSSVAQQQDSTWPDTVKLKLVTQNDDTLLPRLRSHDSPLDDDENLTVLSPQIQIKLLRPKSLNSLYCPPDSPPQDELDQRDKEEITLKKAVSSPDVRNSLRAARNKLRKRFNFVSQRNLSALNEVDEEIELQTPPGSRSTENISRSQRKLDGLLNIFSKNRSKSVGNLLTNRKPKSGIAFSLDDTREAPSDSNDNSVPMTSSGEHDYSSLETDSKKLKSGACAEPVQNSCSIIIEKCADHTGYEVEPATIKISRRSSLRGGQFCTLLRKFTTLLPPDEIGGKPVVIKDATDIFALNNGEAIVTDILSSKMVLFDVYGMPKVTYAMEKGSEPWSTHITPDGIMAVTLKGAGCVSLWSPTGESLTEFGEEVLSSPTGIGCDNRGRFIVADEFNNKISTFSRTGHFLGEFVNQLSPNSAAGNTTGTSGSQDHLTFNQPRFITVSRDGFCFVSDSANQVVKIFDSEGVLLREIGSYGKEDGQFRFPYGVAFDEETKLLYVADHFNNRISVFGLNGSFLYHMLTQADGITRPRGLSVRGANLFVTFGNLRASNISVYRMHAHSVAC